MFGTYRFNQSTNDHEHVVISRADGIEARGYTRTACQACRVQKLKCSGDKHGCKRCRRLSRTCSYEATASASCSTSSVSSSGGSRRPPSAARTPVALSLQCSLGREEQAPPGLPAPSLPASSDGSSGSIMTFPDEPIDSNFWLLSPVTDSFSDTFGDHDLRPGSEPRDGSHVFPPVDDSARGHDDDGAASSGVQISTSQDLSTLLTQSGAASPMDVDSQIWGFGLVPTPRPQVLQQHDGIRNDGSATGASGNDGATLSHYQLPMMRSAVSSIPPASSSTAPRLKDHRNSSVQSFGGHCPCLSTMMEFFESMGAQDFQAAGSDSTNARLDVILMCLSQGLRTFEIVLECDQCNACHDNSTLIATIAQQVGVAAGHGLVKLTSALHGGQREMLQRHADDVLEGPISLGQFKVVCPRLRLDIVYNAVRAHLTYFRHYLNRMKDLVGRNKAAGRMLGETESRISKMSGELARLSLSIDDQ